MKYGYTKKVELEFQEAVQKTKEELQKEGFGVLTEINVKDTLKKKLDVDLEQYIILGACSPKHAYEALRTEKEIGLLLPCNVIVYSSCDDVYVSAIRPEIAMGIVENEGLGLIAKEIEGKLKKVVDSI